MAERHAAEEGPLAESPSSSSVLVTGAAGYLGRLCLERLAAEPGGVETLLGLDVRPVADAERLDGVHHVTEDVRSPALAALLERHRVDTVVHLAFVVNEMGLDRELEYAVDVLGTRNVLEACRAARVRKLIVTSSGAAYGYHADNPVPLRESDPLRGNQAFAYAYHKRLVEEMLARWREEHPKLQQLVLRLCAVLGARAANPITALFEQRVVLDVVGARSGFCFVSDDDVVACLLRGIREDLTGIFNVSGEGTLSVREIARLLGKPRLALPADALRAALWLARRLGLSRYGPEQVPFLRYRPVLSNEKLKREFGYAPRLDSRAVFLRYLEAKGLRRAVAT